MRPYRDQTRLTYRAELSTFSSAPINRAHGLQNAHKLVRSYLPGWKVVKNQTDSRAWCYPDERTISLGKNSPAWMTCHEIAHGLVQEAGIPTGHHEVFRHEYVEVAGEVLGKRWRGSLRRSFEGNGLLVCPDGEQPAGWLGRFIYR